MASYRRCTSVSDNEPVYSARRPKLTVPRHTSTNSVSTTELHQAAENGDIFVLAELLMRTNVHVDVTDAYGRTPLSYAVENDHLQTADWLFFNGADPYKYDHANRSPMSESQSSAMTSLMCQRRHVHGVEFAILLESAEYEINNLGVQIRTGNAFAPSPSYFMCRMLFPTESGTKSWLAPDEMFWREIVEYRTSDRTDNSVVYLKLLFMDKPSRYQELIVKHCGSKDDITEIKPELFSNTSEFAAVSTVKLKRRGIFILCCRPRTEVFPVLSSGGSFVSKSDNSIQLDVPSHAFNKLGNVVLKVDEVSNVPQADHILSLSHFFHIKHSSGSDPTKNVTVTLPTPDGFKGEGDVVIMSRSGSSADLAGHESDDEVDQWLEKTKWSMMDVQPEIQGNSVSFKTSKLGLATPVEVEKGATEANVTIDTAHRYYSRSQQVICFMAVGKCLEYNQFDIIVECLHPSQCSRRLEDWEKDGYKKLRISGDFQAKQGSKFRFQLHGNLRSLFTLQDLSLELFPGQASHQSLILKVKDLDEVPTGSVAILKQQDVGLRLITHLPLLLKDYLSSGVSHNTVITDNISNDLETSFEEMLSQFDHVNANSNAILAMPGQNVVCSDNEKDVMKRKESSSLFTGVSKIKESHKPSAQTVEGTETFDNINHSKNVTPERVSDFQQDGCEHNDVRSNLSSHHTELTACSDVNSNNVHCSTVLPTSSTFHPLECDSDEAQQHVVVNDERFKHDMIHWLAQVIVDVWWKVGICLGFSNQLLTQYDHQQFTGPLENSKLLLTGYFHQNEKQEDLGLRKLVDALHKVHKSDGINCIIELLQTYQQSMTTNNCGYQDDSSRFSRWVLSQEISKTTLFQQFDIPPPLSDEFWVNLVMRLEPNFLLGIKLGLSQAEVERIRQDSSCVGIEYKMFTMFIKCRQKRGNNVSLFNSLLQSLRELEMNETTQWIIQYTKHWADAVSGIQTSLAGQMLSIVRRYDEY